MYRDRVHFFPKGMEAYAELLAAGEEFNKLCADRGWAQGTFFVPVVGEMEAVAEFDYPDLATFQREYEEKMRDPEAMAIMRRLMSMESIRPSYDELLSTAPSFG